MKPQYTKGRWENFFESDSPDTVLVKQDHLYFELLSFSEDVPIDERAGNAQLICSSVNIIQSLADSLGVNAVELAQRMEEGNVIQEILLVLRAFNHPDHKLDCQDILSKLEGRQG